MKKFISSQRRMSSNTPISLKRVVDFLENFAPKSIAEKWDNTGLLLEPQTPTPIDCILLTNDLTIDVTEEAIKLPAQLIISYHPPIFQPLKRITTSTWKERVIGSCLENRIALYSPHTAWDAVQGGVNDWLISALDTVTVTPILKQDHSEQVGAGRLCTLRNPLKLKDVVEKMRDVTKLPQLRIALARNATLDTAITSVAVCAGSGASVLSNVSADLFVTGEMPHHDILNAIHNGASVLLCNHSNSERGFLSQFALKLRAEFPAVKIDVSTVDRDPIGLCLHKIE